MTKEQQTRRWVWWKHRVGPATPAFLLLPGEPRRDKNLNPQRKEPWPCSWGLDWVKRWELSCGSCGPGSSVSRVGWAPGLTYCRDLEHGFVGPGFHRSGSLIVSKSGTRWKLQRKADWPTCGSGDPRGTKARCPLRCRVDAWWIWAPWPIKLTKIDRLLLWVPKIHSQSNMPGNEMGWLADQASQVSSVLCGRHAWIGDNGILIVQGQVALDLTRPHLGFIKLLNMPPSQSETPECFPYMHHSWV